MPLHLSLLADARPNVLEGIAAYQAQISRDSAARDPRKVGQVITQLHLGLEKAFKHRLGTIDEALPLAGLDGGLLQKLRKLQREQSAPSLLAVRTRVDTQGLVGSLHILNSMLAPSLPPGIFDQFVQHCTELTALRNQHTHAEIFGESDELLAAVTRVLSRLRAILTTFHPDLWSDLRLENDQLDAYLTGIENDIDGAWQVLTDFLKAEGPADLTVKAFLTLPAQGAHTNLLMSGTEFVGSSIGLRAHVPPSQVGGFFATPLPPEEARFWELARKAATPPPMGLLTYILELTPEPRNLGAQGFIPSEDGSLRMVGATGRVYLGLKGRKPSFVSANIRVDELTLQFQAQQEEGTVEGTLSSGATLAGAAKSGTLTVRGKVHLEAEYVYQEAVEDAPAGSTVRSVRGTLQLSATI